MVTGNVPFSLFHTNSTHSLSQEMLPSTDRNPLIQNPEAPNSLQWWDKICQVKSHGSKSHPHSSSLSDKDNIFFLTLDAVLQARCTREVLKKFPSDVPAVIRHVAQKGYGVPSLETAKSHLGT